MKSHGDPSQRLTFRNSWKQQRRNGQNGSCGALASSPKVIVARSPGSEYSPAVFASSGNQWMEVHGSKPKLGSWRRAFVILIYHSFRGMLRFCHAQDFFVFCNGHQLTMHPSSTETANHLSCKELTSGTTTQRCCMNFQRPCMDKPMRANNIDEAFMAAALTGFCFCTETPMIQTDQ